MIWIKVEEQTRETCYLDLSKAEAFGLNHNENDFVLWVSIGSNRFYLCSTNSFASAKVKLEKVVDYVILLNTSQPSVIGHYDSIDKLIDYCENRFQ